MWVFVYHSLDFSPSQSNTFDLQLHVRLAVPTFSADYFTVDLICCNEFLSLLFGDSCIDRSIRRNDLRQTISADTSSVVRLLGERKLLDELYYKPWLYIFEPATNTYGSKWEQVKVNVYTQHSFYSWIGSLPRLYEEKFLIGRLAITGSCVNVQVN